MSKKQWFLLWLIFMSYLFLGATVFYYLERKLELERRHIVRGEQEEIEDLLRLNYASDAPQAQEQILLRLAEYCGKPFSTKKMTTKEVDGNATTTDHNATATDRNSTDAACDDDPDSDVTCEDEKPIRWTFYNSFFFALTTLSTIGYGNLSPTSMEGRLLVICYSLIGIPLNGIVLSQLGECFGSTFMRVHHRYKTHHFETKLSLIMDIIMYLIPGVVFFIFIPSGFFVYFEGWTFDESIYYAFVTLTTIGYGDFVAGQTGSDNPWYNIYKVLLIIWFMFGLGYLVMILGFIARAMQSKKIARLEQAVTQTLKQTQNKIWKEFTHEVTVVRRALNEMYLLKVKPVYRDGAEVGPLLGSKRLSRSAPQLSEWPVLRPREPQQDSGEDLEAEEDLEAAFRAKRLQRRQAFSENVLKARPQRTASDGDLTLIDRTATFRSATPVEPGLLLARIVDAIGTPIPVRGHDSASESGSDDYRPPKYSGGYGDGINMFSDSDILASEWGEDNRDRSRTQSAVLSPPPYHSDYDEQRTWSGNEYNHYKNNLSHDPMPSKDGVWSQSDQLLAPARGLRRMSMAAINFFTPAARWVKRSSLQKSNPDIHQHQNQQQTKTRERKISSYGKARTRQPGINRHASDGYLKKHRYSLQDNGHVRRSEDEQVVDDSVNYLSYTTGRRPSLLAALAREMGPKRDSTSSISPVLEQTSVADFIRVLTTLHDNQDHERDHSMTICNGDTTRRASSRRLFRSTSTLDNYRRAEAVNPSLVTSDAAFTPTQTASDVRRRRFSFVPTLSSFSTNEKPPVKKLSTEGLFQRRRSRSQSVSPVDSSLSLAAMPAPVDRRIRRMSSSGSKDKSFLGRRSFSVMASPRGPPPPLLKTLTPPRLVITSPEGHEQGTEHSRFTVSQADSSVAIQKQDDPAAGSNNQQSASVAWQASPSQDATSNDEKDSLTDVVVVKL